ncbi:isopentenyl pyrophosphate isomerase [Sorangium cellulosum]|jgi:isopentenyl-diphosphate delta-isomerase|uniref:Isopentenyl-diphosphate delta-isomerase n=1 Tax=Sorangium cellulosum TaxID=56 RepID=A0A4P2PXA0_SORCE|nr:type 2 isopentenyl-diphosphate Delta-isomerase [Sorangium cellulosum]AUX21148.1 isopentenyl pyrophosphate isomerase [Sorangium cellulosum]
MTDEAKDISERKADHIELCATGDVGFRTKTTLLEQVELIHDALPELSLDAVDTSALLLGKRLRAPLLIAAMTGGTERAQSINQELSRIAEERGYGFGLGSQRAMLNGDAAATYEVRAHAPTALVLGNIGAVQARSLSTDAVAELVAQVGADALCVHMNPAMELVQPGGDRDFSGALEAISRLSNELSVPVVAKETGCGIGPGTAYRLVRAGVRNVDVSGAGGTSWVAVETARADGAARSLGETLRDWGVPTAASVLVARTIRPRFKTIIATGGITTGLDIARALALGAHAAGIARPVLQAFISGGRDAAVQYLENVEAELRAVMLLVGARDIASLRKAPALLGRDLRRWSKLMKQMAQMEKD